MQGSCNKFFCDFRNKKKLKNKKYCMLALSCSDINDALCCTCPNIKRPVFLIDPSGWQLASSFEFSIASRLGSGIKFNFLFNNTGRGADPAAAAVVGRLTGRRPNKPSIDVAVRVTDAG